MDTRLGCNSNQHNANIRTPARRLETTRTGKLLHDALDKEWTTARCQRLLRKLTSRVAILRKEVDRYSNSKLSSCESQTFCSASEAITDLKIKKPADWVKKNKKPKRTYGGLRKSQQPHTKSLKHLDLIKKKEPFLPGEVIVPTPVLARVRGGRCVEEDVTVKADLKKNSMGSLKGEKTSCSKNLREDCQFQLPGHGESRKNAINTQLDTYGGIYHGFETLLQTTSNTQTATKLKGTRSLFDMVLRAVPRYILQQQYLLEAYMRETGCKSTIDERDICCEIYDEIESFGSSGNGWKKLREIVRAHGVQVIADTIKEGLIDFDFCNSLISLCIHAGAPEEGQVLLSSLLAGTTYSKPKTLDESLCKPLFLLQKFTNNTNRTSFFYRELSNLISEDILPVEWLASTNLGTIWTGLIQSFTLDSLECEAYNFCDIAFSLFLKYPNITSAYRGTENKTTNVPCNSDGMEDAIKNTFTSILTFLLSIVLLDKNSEKKNHIKNGDSIFGRFDFIVSFLRGCLNYKPVNNEVNEQYLLLLIANLILYEEHYQSKPGRSLLDKLSKLLKYTQDLNSVVSQIAIFICQVAQCCGRGTSGLGYDYLQLIHLRLNSIDSEQGITNFLKGIMVDSAFIFARKVPHHQHVEYATCMNATYLPHFHTTATCFISSSSRINEKHLNRFRWEEGIGEWVTVTPALRKPKRKADGMGSPECHGLSRKLPHLSQNFMYRSVTCSKNVPGPIINATSDIPEFLFTPFHNSENYVKSYNSALTPKRKISNDSLQRCVGYESDEASNRKYLRLPQKFEKIVGAGTSTNDKFIRYKTEFSCHPDPIFSARSPTLLGSRAYQYLHYINDTPSRICVNKVISETKVGASFRSSDRTKSSNESSKDSYQLLLDIQAEEFPRWSDDEDELSLLSSINSPTRNNKYAPSQVQSHLFQEAQTSSKISTKNSMEIGRHDHPSLRANSNKSDALIGDLKKCFLTKRRSQRLRQLGNQDWSEDELCI
ncbi:hypothetical protein GcM3_214004 [Golovinomyces cichoracearum]|uniref:Uncharacterized protein n=1 Tax=Golovinomyces cichoracearum TaxID=62708 RepID=A0A420H8X1_9PEZI|nr:hypothetical protein GcM3_214004 [Golovinomyces cichoracearum]